MFGSIFTQKEKREKEEREVKKTNIQCVWGSIIVITTIITNMNISGLGIFK